MNLQRLSQLELRQIYYFFVVVESGNSFSRAADRLHIAQPPVSQRISSLEKALKVELFDRNRRPMHLTAAGQVFYDQAKAALTDLERAVIQAKAANAGDIGHLSIGISSAITNSILPDILRLWRERYPQVQLELRELTLQQQLKALADRQLDVGFEHLPLTDRADRQDTNLNSRTVFREALVVALPTHHPLAALPSLTLEALTQAPILLPSIVAFPFYQAVLDQFEQLGLEPQVVQNTQATWLLTLLSMVAGGMGLAILPASNVETITRQGVVYRPLQNLPLTRKISVIWHQDNTSAVVSGFLKVVETQKKDWVGNADGIFAN
jgi:DNA-binding transcriptional LysR family regulator